MSTYSFKMTKDSTVNSSMPDVSVVILLDDVQVTSGTLGSSELTLTFTADLSAGNHKIKIGIASWYPLWRMVELLDKNKKDRIIIVSNDDREDSDYIYSNRIYDVDKRVYKKYNISQEFNKIKEYKIDSAIIYEVYKKVK